MTSKPARDVSPTRPASPVDSTSRPAEGSHEPGTITPRLLAIGLGYESLREATDLLFDRCIAAETDLAAALQWRAERRGRRGYHRAARVACERARRAVSAAEALDYALARLAIWARLYSCSLHLFREQDAQW